MGLSKSEQKRLNQYKINALGVFQSYRLALIPSLSQVPAFTMKKINEGIVRDANIHRQLKASPGFKGQFRVSTERLREIGRKGVEQMERLNRSDIGDIAE